MEGKSSHRGVINWIVQFIGHLPAGSEAVLCATVRFPGFGLQKPEAKQIVPSLPRMWPLFHTALQWEWSFLQGFYGVLVCVFVWVTVTKSISCSFWRFGWGVLPLSMTTFTAHSESSLQDGRQSKREKEQSVGAFMLRLLRQFNVPPFFCPSYCFLHVFFSFPPTLLRSYDIYSIQSTSAGGRLRHRRFVGGLLFFPPFSYRASRVCLLPLSSPNRL